MVDTLNQGMVGVQGNQVDRAHTLLPPFSLPPIPVQSSTTTTSYCPIGWGKIGPDLPIYPQGYPRWNYQGSIGVPSMEIRGRHNRFHSVATKGVVNVDVAILCGYSGK